ncbi:MAG: AAA family ATPase [Pseudomonadota bacterium]
MIIGPPGSGKSEGARQLAALTGLPVVHTDQIFWTPGWVQRDQAAREGLARAAAEEDAWIIEGGIAATWDIRLSRADTVIHFDTPLGLRVWRIFFRTLRYYGRTRADLAEGCPERFDPVFWRYIWTTRRSQRIRYEAACARARDSGICDVHVFRTRRAWDRWLATRR